MRYYACMIMVLLFIATSGLAQTMYVSQDLQITMRTGPGTEHKIIAFLKSGQELTLLEQSKDWSRVKLVDGREGYALTRFLTSEKPCHLLLENLEAKHEKLNQWASKLKEENELLKNDNKQLSTELADRKKALEQVSSSFSSLKSEAAGVIELKAKFDRTERELEKQKKIADTLEEKLNGWWFKFYWLLSGAGIFILGWLIGYSLKRQKKRSSLL